MFKNLIMDELDEGEVLYTRVKKVSENFSETIGEYMPSLNETSSGGTEARIAFDMLERILYNVSGVSVLYEKYSVNHNMAVPLSQIFRAIVYDVVICFWLFEEGTFESNIIKLNSDFIKKNSKRLTDIYGVQRLQQTYVNWMKVAPYSFDVQETNSGFANIIPVIDKMPSFEDISRNLKSREDASGMYNSLYLIYHVLSQQAHVSAFSKELIYSNFNRQLKAFDSSIHAVLVCSVLLLQKIAHGDYQNVIKKITNIDKKYYP